MSRIHQLFSRKRQDILNIYFTAGFPFLDATRKVMKALADHGADMIEIGIPFSDPLADGPVIQQSNGVALSNGMTIAKLFEQLRSMRDVDDAMYIGEIPVVLMGYMNPVLQYGFEKFCRDADACGVDGIIIPDLPVYEFESGYGALIRKYGLDFIFLITPETPADRIRKLDSLSSGFLYAVSASGTTGGDGQAPATGGYLERLKNMKLANPLLVGFGIAGRPAFNIACRYAAGAIVGSAYIRALEKDPDVNAATKSFISSLLG
jgi:tryptophan synthase alpha chain